ncbi:MULTISPECIES: cutinase family protein [unclassified Mycolicibacterium]|uniref:cutinase family protein n=1 Tax=unclassified Mycolicibacterium TaxID=2636767 RepID=UPI00192E4E1C|nr:MULTISPECIES: cutinase family protein [unclassified Mycolicibacterium]
MTGATAVILVLQPGLLSAGPLATAHAADCPDAQVIFARGTDEAPGPGEVGIAFTNGLRTAISPKTLDVYAVDYPATTDFPTAVDGIRDARRQIVATTAACPRTKMVLGGFSQGAAVMGFVTAGTIPDGISATDVPAPMPPDIADHVAAVALFGKPSPRFMRAIGSPAVSVGPVYQPKTTDLCVTNDLICDAHGSSFDAHNGYVDSGLVTQGVNFTAGQLQAGWAADALAGPAPWSAPVPAADQAAHGQPAPAATPPTTAAPAHMPPAAPTLPGPQQAPPTPVPDAAPQ